MISIEGESYIFRIKRDEYTEPKDYTKYPFSCYDFFKSVHIFLNKNFEGAITLDFPKSFDGAVNISPRGFAYFIRVLLAEVFGNALVRSEFTITNDEIIFSLSVPDDLKCAQELKNIAEKTGFSFEYENGKITLRTKRIIPATLYVYANDMLKFLNYMYEVFFDGHL